MGALTQPSHSSRIMEAFGQTAQLLLLASTSEEDKLAARSRCNREGYESVALIPLRSCGDTIGLLQINDRRENLFTPFLLSLLEEISAVAANAIGQRLVHEALEKSEQRFRSLVENANDWFWEVDEHLVCTYMSPNVRRLLGADPEDSLGKTLSGLIAPEERLQILDAAGRHDYLSLVEAKITCKDGSVVYAESNAVPIFDETGVFRGYRGASRDVTSRKANERALVMTQFCVDHSADGIMSLNSEGRVVYANDAVCNLLDRTRSEVAALAIWDFDTASDLAQSEWPSRWRELLAQRSINRESAVARKDGTTSIVDVSISYFEFDGAGYTFALIKDATQRKQAEEALKRRATQQALIAELGKRSLAATELEPLYEAAVSCLCQGLEIEMAAVIEVLPDGKHVIAWANGSLQEFTASGKAIPLEAGGWAHYTLLRGAPVIVDDYAGDERLVPQPILLEHGVASGISVVISQRERVFGVLSGYSLARRVFSAEDAHFMESAADVVGIALERLQAEAQLRIHTSLIASASDQIVIMDSDGTVEFVNPAFLKASGYGLEEVAGRHADTLPYILNPEQRQEMNRNVVAGKTWHGEMKMRRRDGELRYLDLTITPITDPAGAVEHLAATMRDITESKLYNEHLNQTNRLETVGKLAAGIAHDFNNMLQGVLGYTQSLLANQSLDECAVEDANGIEKTSLRAADIVRQILTFSRQMPPKVAPVNAASLAQEVVRLVKNTFPKTIFVSCSMSNTKAVTVADSSQIHQVLMNLCVNARTALLNGGAIHIGVDTVEMDDDFVAANPWARKGEFVRWWVADNGCGMDAETCARAFEPFFSTRQDGTGLGLSTSYGIVQNHDGLINISSTPGQGTKVSIYLPLSNECAVPAKSVTDERAKHGSESVLLVEDEDHIRTFTARALERCGYRVSVARNGLEAVEIANSAEAGIDLILMDINMPEMDGIQAMSLIRSVSPDVAGLFTAGLIYDTEDLPPEVKTIPASAKPYRTEVLLSTIRELLDARLNGTAPGTT